MAGISTLELVVALSERPGRVAALEALASRLQVDAVLLFARDPALGALIPVPGVPQTVRGGRTLRTFLAGCVENGRCAGVVELPKGTHRPVLALVHRDTAMVLLGGAPSESEVVQVERVLPLLEAMLAAEQQAVVAQAEAAAEKDAAGRAHALAAALDMARADASALNAELREEERRKDEFLAMLGHELRNPLSPLVTSIQVLRMKGPADPIPDGLVELMSRQTAQLSRLVDDLLDVSRVSRGRIELRCDRLLLGEVVMHALDESRALIEAARHEVVLSGTEEPLAVSGDRARLTQVFGNLLTNAAKYTDPGGRISVTISREQQHAIVRVQDTGIGISPDMLAPIFQLFAQANVALGRAQGGLGIGLTLVRTLVELHGGRIAAASPGAGQGSTFTVSLPLAPAQAVSKPAPPVPGNDVAENPVRVLVVDDNRDAADSITALLRRMGHHVDVAYDARSALELPAKAHADLILLDLGLPGMSGYELARELRATAKSSARFVALTGYGTEESRLRSHEAGLDEHLVKPATVEKLRGLIALAAKRG